MKMKADSRKQNEGDSGAVETKPTAGFKAEQRAERKSIPPRQQEQLFQTPAQVYWKCITSQTQSELI